LHEEVTSTCASNMGCVVDGFSPAVVTNSATRLGWTVGGGIETALWGHWLARAEYRYADFGAPSFTVSRASTVAAFNPTADTFNLAVRTHTATFGLAYKLGDPIPADTSSRPSMMPVKAMVKSAPAAVSWSGPYAGLGLGLRASRTDATKTSDNTVAPFNSGNANTLPLDGVAFRGSPYVGYNWQVAPGWVTGVEADFGFADQTTTLGGIEFAPGGGQSTNAPDGGNDGFSVRNTWDASLRGRLGYLVTPTWLVYGTAGVAWQHFDVTSTCVSPSFCVLNGFTPAVISFSTTRTGWTVGGGAVGPLAGSGRVPLRGSRNSDIQPQPRVHDR
jgi:outer membrane immunogenic protein